MHYLSAILMLIAITGAHVKANIVSEEYEGSLYTLSEETFKYEDAKKFCEEKRGTLVVITKKEEYDFVLSFIRDNANQDAWIGLSKTPNSNNWRWVDDTPFVLHNSNYFQLWAEYPHDTEPTTPAHMCIRQRTQTDIGWADISCAKTYLAVCENEAVSGAECLTNWTAPSDWENEPCLTVNLNFKNLDQFKVNGELPSGVQAKQFRDYAPIVPSMWGVFVFNEAGFNLGDWSSVSCIMNPGDCANGFTLSVLFHDIPDPGKVIFTTKTQADTQYVEIRYSEDQNSIIATIRTDTRVGEVECGPINFNNRLTISMEPDKETFTALKELQEYPDLPLHTTSDGHTAERNTGFAMLGDEVFVFEVLVWDTALTTNQMKSIIREDLHYEYYDYFNNIDWLYAD